MLSATATTFNPPIPLPDALALARDRVGRDYRVDSSWLDAEAADVGRLGLPQGFMNRVVTRTYSSALIVHFASRYDLIHMKLHALVDRGPGGKHEQDLRALNPTREKLLAAARWAMTHDPSEGFRSVMDSALRHLGVENAGLGP